MKRCIHILILFFVLITLSNCKKVENDILYDKNYLDEIKQVRKEIAGYMRINFIPGAQIAIAKNGEIIYSEGIGLASKDLNVPVSRDTKFRIGPLSELYTTLLYLKLVEDGILTPDSTVQHYLPEFPEKEFPITLNHLVNHTSGIRGLKSNESTWLASNVTMQKGLDLFKDDELLAPPGDYQQESRFNFNLLGVIMEEATGNSFGELLKGYVTDTLQLNHTCLDNPYATKEGRSNFFHHNIIAQVVNALSIDLRWRASSEGLLSSAEDLVNLSNVYMKSSYLNDSTRAHLFEPLLLKYDKPSKLINGWTILEDREGNVAYARKGYVHGGSSEVFMYPKEELVIALTTNLTQEQSNSPIFKLAEIFMKMPEQK